jgi:hypothetical protein
VVTLGPMAQANTSWTWIPITTPFKVITGYYDILKWDKVLGTALGRVHSQKKGPTSSPQFWKCPHLVAFKE